MHDELNDAARMLIDRTRAGESPPAGSRDRVRTALSAKLGVAAFGTAAVAHATGVSLWVTAKVALAALTVVAAGSGLALHWTSQPDNATARVAYEQPAVAVQPEVKPLVRAVQPVQANPLPRRLVPRRASPVTDTNSLLKETAALAAAQTKLRDGEPTAALTLLKAYDVQHPAGILREESEATRVQAWLDLGDRDRACKLSRGFVQRWPRSPHLVRVRSACEKP